VEEKALRVKKNWKGRKIQGNQNDYASWTPYKQKVSGNLFLQRRIGESPWQSEMWKKKGIKYVKRITRRLSTWAGRHRL